MKIETSRFNISAFRAAANGTIGNIGRNTVAGPGYANLDAAIAKSFPIAESVRLKFQSSITSPTR